MRINSKEKKKMEMARVAVWLAVFMGSVWQWQAGVAVGGRDAEPWTEMRRVREAERDATECGSRSMEELHRLFAEAQRERRQQRYTQADGVYAAIIEGTCNSTSSHLELRMWTQFQHADLLMRHIAPRVDQVEGPHASDDIKSRAISKFRDALHLSEAVASGETTSSDVFGSAERVHAHNTVGMLSMELGHYTQAIESFQYAAATDANAFEPLGNLGLLFLNAGRLSDAMEVTERALKLRPDDTRLLHNAGAIHFDTGNDIQAESYWRRVLQIKADSVETLSSLAGIVGSRGDSEESQSLLLRAEELARPGPMQRSICLQLALNHFRMIYDSREDIQASRSQYEAGIAHCRHNRGHLPNPLTTIGSGSMGYYAIYQGFHDRDIRYEFAQIYRANAGEYLNFVAPHVAEGRQTRYEFITSHEKLSVSFPSFTVAMRRRIRVGFLSTFLRHHSVGLLISGVMRYLSRDQFEVIAITFDSMVHDKLTRSVLELVDKSLVLPSVDLRASQRLISSLELDILVFSELGMHAASYFLAFSHLALRSVAFWGHAITSGIDSVDYFVSSKLFRQHQDREEDHERYTECLFEMDGLTTVFPRPPPPHSDLTRASLGLPDKSLMAHMVLVPQTLYKLHPDFDFIIQRVLSSVRSSFLVLPIGAKPLLVQQLTRRWRRGSVISAEVYRRIFFVRALNQTEFLAVCAMSDLVLDPFPVGGGRSSFEVFSVGTPILGLTSRTTILQLTLAMYRRMGIGAKCCMFETEDQVVEAAVELLQNMTKRLGLRDRILRNNYKLYAGSNYPVVREWERFFKLILANDAPQPPISDAHRTTLSCVYEAPQGQLQPRLMYEIRVHGMVSAPAMQSIRLSDHDDPFQIAESLTSDILQAAYLGKLLWNMQQRFLHRVVDSFFVLPDVYGSSLAIEIRAGDDLHQVVRWQVRTAIQRLPAQFQRASEDELTSLALSIASARVPQHTAHEWRRHRAIVPPREFSSEELVHDQKRDCIALIVTTCKRLSLFLQTMASLTRVLGITRSSQWHDWFCERMVVDDNSSEDDRQRMKREYPSFRFILKSPDDKGHARSLNIALRAIQGVRYVMYLEDDWAFRRHHSNGRFLLDALAILRSTRLAQVLINDQDSGYAAQLTTPSGHVVQYAVHEFAVTDPSHEFSYWPGFSLNPGVWDLRKLHIVLRELEEDRDQGPFQEDTDIFEREFSLRVWRAGLEVGYLRGEVVCDHIGAPPGTNASAYVLNGLPRRFD